MGKLKKETTDRGFSIIRFEDIYGAKCSLQKSSSAMVDAVWLGPSITADGADNQRMQLSRDQVKNLLPFLRNFVKTGDI